MSQLVAGLSHVAADLALFLLGLLLSFYFWFLRDPDSFLAFLEWLKRPFKR